MNRFDLPVSDTVAGVVIAAGLGAVVAVTLTMAVMNDRQNAEPKTPVPADPYENCLLAASDPGPAGFAGEVCEPLMQGFEHPFVTLRSSDFGLDGCVTFPARVDFDAIRYCPVLTPEATP